MYIKKTNNKTHTKYTNEEKEKIVLLYLNHEMGLTRILREYDIASDSVFYRWVKNYRKNGCITDGRGKATKFITPNKGRPRKYPERPLEELSKEELIEKVRMLEDIKKSLVYLSSQNPKTNTK
jgi:transposase-like protein